MAGMCFDAGGGGIGAVAGGEEGVTNFWAISSLDVHTALRARSLCCECLFFALSQRTGEEKTLKGRMPLRNPQDFSLLLSFGGYQKAL